MTSGTEQRKLAAIMFTDMVGYSALAQRDEALALDLLEEHHQILRDVLLMFQGNEIKSTGDGLLVEFASALAAVQCAIEIQRTLAERNEKKSEERQIQIRIGIHLGDVVKRGDDVLGDGANIAARIEPLAEPGGICVTQAVFEQIENKVPQPCVRLDAAGSGEMPAGVGVFKLVLEPSPADVHAADASRKQLQWLVLGVVVVNVILFLVFGLNRKSVQDSTAVERQFTNSVIVEAACGQCQFKLPGKDCDLAVRMDGQCYFVDGAQIDQFGDAHAADGFCNAVRQARVTGQTKNGRFVAVSFELLPAK